MTRAVYRGPWRVDLTVREGVTTPIAGNALARVVADALDAGGAPSPASIGLILSDDAELAALNEAHLGVTGATDVLSFPIDGAAPLPEGEPRALGDVVLCPEVIGDEWRWPLVHGLLHLLGHEHGPAMEACERVHLS